MSHSNVDDAYNIFDLRELLDPAVKARLVQEGAEAIGSAPGENAAYLRNEVERWSQVAKSADLKLE